MFSHLLLGLAIVAVIGIAGSSFLFPIFALCIFKTVTKFSKAETQKIKTLPIQSAQSQTVDVLIPAHNEEALIADTIESIHAAFNTHHMSQTNEREKIFYSIFVGADSCSDNTVALSTAHGAHVFQTHCKQKWGTLQLLLEQSRAEWIAFVDAGSLWEPQLLDAVYKLSTQEKVIGISPTYKEEHSGLLKKVAWGAERLFKDLENYSGGPISVHGATVFYRREPLKKVFAALSAQHWFNDDVVVPLLLRAQNPTKRIVYCNRKYPNCVVKDRGLRTLSQEGGARIRMVHGNLQWIHGLLPSLILKSPLVAMLALRRVFRMYWLLWGLILGAACFGKMLNLFLKEDTVLKVFLIVLLEVLLLGSAKLVAPRFFAVAWASLRALVSPQGFKKVKWS